MSQEYLNKAADIIARHSVHSGCSDKILVCALGMIDLDGALCPQIYNRTL